MTIDSFITAAEAAELIQCSVQHARGLARTGELIAEKVGGAWLIDYESVNTYLGRSDAEGDVPDHDARRRQVPARVGLSFFTGAMGLDLGLEASGIEFALACEVDQASRRTIETNRPELALIGDIREFTADSIRQAAGLATTDDIFVVAGGPPCQAFSSAGRRQGFADERGNVFVDFIDRAIELQPQYIVVENVRGLMSMALEPRPADGNADAVAHLPGSALYYVVGRLRDAGYGVSFNLYNAANFGAPQKRERVVIIASSDGREMPYLRPTHSEHGLFDLPPWRTLKEAIGDLTGIEHEYVRFPEKRLKYYRMIQEGSNWRSLPTQLQAEALGKSFTAGGGRTGFLRRLAWDQPAPTLVTHPAMPATDLCHPTEDRPLSVQEYKRLQEFPDEWHLSGSVINRYRQVGNAVPVSLGRAIGRLLTETASQTSPQYPGFPYSRYRGTDHVSWTADFIRRASQLPSQARLF